VTAHGLGEPRWAETVAEIETRKTGERPRMLARLGIGEAVRSPRGAARAGMLWSEVLGPPLALRHGPRRRPRG
jgi:hypothetical protein